MYLINTTLAFVQWFQALMHISRVTKEAMNNFTLWICVISKNKFADLIVMISCQGNHILVSTVNDKHLILKLMETIHELFY